MAPGRLYEVDTNLDDVFTMKAKPAKPADNQDNTQQVCSTGDVHTSKVDPICPKGKLPNNGNKPASPIIKTFTYKRGGTAKIMVYITKEPEELVYFIVDKSLLERHASNWANIVNDNPPKFLNNGKPVPRNNDHDHIKTGHWWKTPERQTVDALDLLMQILHSNLTDSFPTWVGSVTLALFGWLSHNRFGLQTISNWQGMMWAGQLSTNPTQMPLVNAMWKMCGALRFNDEKMWNSTVEAVRTRAQLDNDGNFTDHKGRPFYIPDNNVMRESVWSTLNNIKEMWKTGKKKDLSMPTNENAQRREKVHKN